MFYVDQSLADNYRKYVRKPHLYRKYHMENNQVTTSLNPPQLRKTAAVVMRPHDSTGVTVKTPWFNLNHRLSTT
jgi:hypothetical protein